MEWVMANLAYLIIGVVLLVLLACYRLVLRVAGVYIVPENKVGIVFKKWKLFGANKTLPDGKIIALNGEAGIQADALPPGVHFWLWPWQYDIKEESFYVVPEGQLGVVEAADGEPLTDGAVLGRRVQCDSYQNARQFLMNKGQRGPQRVIIPPGTYRINTGVFKIELEPVTEIEDNTVGVVTVRDGAALPKGEIAGREIAGHNSFQDADAFVQAGGFRGLQEQVILAGRYFINPRFATVETKPMTDVPIAHVGVVIAYVGEPGKDLTGDAFKHGNLVSRGEKGVWQDPFDPGKYAVNPYTHKVEIVPTANVVLNWATGKTEAHNLDKNLSTITVRSADGFTFNLDVSQIIHIPRNMASMVIARFGSMANLVTQVLEPTIGNYFRNAAQGSDVIEFLKHRQERQSDARNAIETALKEYNVGAVDTLIGDIVPPESLMKTLTDRKLAEQEKITFGTQMDAQKTRQELEQATALADTQKKVVDAERKVTIAEFDAQSAVKAAEGQAKATVIGAEASAKAKVANAEGDAKAKVAVANGDATSKTVNAEADAKVLRTVAEAKAENVLKVGEAEAAVIRKKTEAIGQDNYAVIEVGRALAEGNNPLVPHIVCGGGEGGGGQTSSSIVSVLMAKLLEDHVLDVTPAAAPATPAPASPAKS